MNKKNIDITCKGNREMELDDFKALQGNLKTLPEKNMERLKRSIREFGFRIPVFVWERYIIDGHQRLLAVRELIKEGYQIGKIPIVDIEAKNLSEAKELLLLVNSRYTEVDEEKVINNKLDLKGMADIINIPEIRLNSLAWSSDIQMEKNIIEIDQKIKEIISIRIKCHAKDKNKIKKLLINEINRLGFSGVVIE